MFRRSDIPEFIRDYRSVLRSCLRTWGPLKGWRLAWLWALLGQSLRVEYREMLAAGLVPPGEVTQ